MNTKWEKWLFMFAHKNVMYTCHIVLIAFGYFGRNRNICYCYLFYWIALLICMFILFIWLIWFLFVRFFVTPPCFFFVFFFAYICLLNLLSLFSIFAFDSGGAFVSIKLKSNKPHCICITPWGSYNEQQTKQNENCPEPWMDATKGAAMHMKSGSRL